MKIKITSLPQGVFPFWIRHALIGLYLEGQTVVQRGRNVITLGGSHCSSKTNFLVAVEYQEFDRRLTTHCPRAAMEINNLIKNKAVLILVKSAFGTALP